MSNPSNPQSKIADPATLADGSSTIYELVTDDIQQVAEETLGRNLSGNELKVVKSDLELDWYDCVSELIDRSFQ